MVERIISDTFDFTSHPKTKGGITSYDGLITCLDTHRTTQLKKRIVGLEEKLSSHGGILNFLGTKYYDEEKSFRDISKQLLEIGVDLPDGTIQGWFKKFGWEARDSLLEVSDQAKIKMSQAHTGNTNASKEHERMRRITERRVNGILKICANGEISEFDKKKFYAYKRPIDRVIYVLTQFGYENDIIDQITKKYNSLNIGPQAISTIINTIVETIIIEFGLDVDAPKISKQTIKYKITKLL